MSFSPGRGLRGRCRGHGPQRFRVDEWGHRHWAADAVLPWRPALPLFWWEVRLPQPPWWACQARASSAHRRRAQESRPNLHRRPERSRPWRQGGAALQLHHLDRLFWAVVWTLARPLSGWRVGGQTSCPSAAAHARFFAAPPCHQPRSEPLCCICPAGAHSLQRAPEQPLCRRAHGPCAGWLPRPSTTAHGPSLAAVAAASVEPVQSMGPTRGSLPSRARRRLAESQRSMVGGAGDGVQAVRRHRGRSASERPAASRALPIRAPSVAPTP
mmetsp:Transcript_33412/g.87624  ORF Transcript_33412/g.87624 Transcript_33412/m.87624 type:complete len:270 (-) Transcript_33412:1308-2117(-)